MGKSVYSLVLSDDIVAAVDALAAQEGYRRSAFIDHILAQYASLPTAEARRRQTIQAAQLAAEGYFRGAVTQGGALTLRTALRYKYNPSLCYTIELWPGQPQMGRLRVALRSQSDSLLGYFGYFFQLWQNMEQRHLASPPRQNEQLVEEKRYSRVLRQPQGQLDEDQTGQAIAAYVNMMDSCLKTFFGCLDDAQRAVAETEKQYVKQLRAHGGLRWL